MALESPLGNLFLLIQDRIRTAVSAVKWIDQDFGQLDYSAADYKPPVLFPCVLVDLTAFVFEDLTNGLQTASGKALIRISTSPFSHSNQATPLANKEKALEYYELEYKIAKALHNWQPAGFDRLLRRNLDKVERQDTLRERLLVFDVSFTDSSAKPVMQTVPRPDPIVGGDVLQEG
jgi:hypothetical protein